MAYSGWSNSLWYIFRFPTLTGEKEEELLACWYSPDLFDAGCLTYTEVKQFLKNPDWSLWSNLESKDCQTLIDCMDMFIRGMDDKY